MKKHHYLVILLTSLCWVSCLTEKPVEKYPKEEEGPNDYIFRQRAYPNNEIDQADWTKALQQTKFAKTTTAKRQANWTLKGPTNIGGRINDVLIHPTDLSIMYIGASVGGIFKTTDGGANWFPIFDDAGSLTIGNLAMDPTNPDILYAGTGEANGSAASGAFFGDGIYKSTDAGATWQNIGLEASQHIGRIVIDPINPNNIFVAVAGILYDKNDYKGAFRSTDGGVNWEKVLFVSDSTSCIDIAINPQNPNIVYASMWERIRRPWQRQYGGLTSGLYRSLDGGDTWSLMTNGLPNNDPNVGRIGVAVAPSDPNTVYASFTTNPITNVFDGLYKTIDGGDSWAMVNSGALGNVYASFGWFFGNVRVNPVDPDDVFVLGVDLFKTQNGGDNWNDVTGNLHADQHALEFFQGDPNVILIGNDGGAYLSTNGGNNWTHLNNIPITQFYEIEVDHSNPDFIYGGAQDNGTLRTQTGNLNDWTRIFGGDGFYVNVNPNNSSIVFIEYQWGNLYRSLDGGFFFESKTLGIDDNDRTNWNTPYIMAPHNPTTLYYGTNKLYKTFSNAEFWSAISGDLTTGQHPSGSLSFGTITSIAAGLSAPNTIMVGTDDGNVQRTQNSGSTWSLVSNSLPNRHVTKVAIDPFNDQICYVTFSGYRDNDYLPHVFRSVDGGQNWVDISSNLPEIPVNDIVIDSASISTLYIANDMGVWVTEDLGGSWNLMGDNLPITIVNDLDINWVNRELVAGTFGRSVYSIPLLSPLLSSKSPKRDNNRLKIFPNPCLDECQISLDFLGDSNGVLSIFDVNGNRVRSEIWQGQLSNFGTQKINVSDLPIGNYFLRMSTSTEILTAKLIKH